MATKDSIMKQSIFFWVFGHRLSFEYGLKKFLFGAWRNLSGALRELIHKNPQNKTALYFFLFVTYNVYSNVRMATGCVDSMFNAQCAILMTSLKVTISSS